jgi:hypothetical protein
MGPTAPAAETSTPARARPEPAERRHSATPRPHRQRGPGARKGWEQGTTPDDRRQQLPPPTGRYPRRARMGPTGPTVGTLLRPEEPAARATWPRPAQPAPAGKQARGSGRRAARRRPVARAAKQPRTSPRRLPTRPPPQGRRPTLHARSHRPHRSVPSHRAGPEHGSPRDAPARPCAPPAQPGKARAARPTGAPTQPAHRAEDQLPTREAIGPIGASPATGLSPRDGSSPGGSPAAGRTSGGQAGQAKPEKQRAPTRGRAGQEPLRTASPQTGRRPQRTAARRSAGAARGQGDRAVPRPVGPPCSCARRSPDPRKGRLRGGAPVAPFPKRTVTYRLGALLG